ncbi:hypothetical protein Hanom_Chr15g01390091 [Helianthus anomalus]
MKVEGSKLKDKLNTEEVLPHKPFFKQRIASLLVVVSHFLLNNLQIHPSKFFFFHLLPPPISPFPLISDYLSVHPSESLLAMGDYGRISVHDALGGGAVADILLWRNVYGGGVVVIVSTIFWFLFERGGYNIVAFVANNLLLLVVILFFWAKSATLLNRFVCFYIWFWRLIAVVLGF